MAYFRAHTQKAHVPAFSEDAEALLDAQDMEDSFPEEEGSPWDWEEEAEEREAQRDRYRLFHGATDFFSAVVGTVCILILIAFIISLLSWVQSDLTQSFSLLGNI